MYRDEILAIGEAVRDAVKAGSADMRSELGVEINALTHAVECLYRFVKTCSTVEQALIPAVQPAEDAEQIIKMLKALTGRK